MNNHPLSSEYRWSISRNAVPETVEDIILAVSKCHSGNWAEAKKIAEAVASAIAEEEIRHVRILY